MRGKGRYGESREEESKQINCRGKRVGGEKVKKRKSWVRKKEDIEKAEKKDENRESIG